MPQRFSELRREFEKAYSVYPGQVKVQAFSVNLEETLVLAARINGDLKVRAVLDDDVMPDSWHDTPAVVPLGASGVESDRIEYVAIGMTKSAAREFDRLASLAGASLPNSVVRDLRRFLPTDPVTLWVLLLWNSDFWDGRAQVCKFPGPPAFHEPFAASAYEAERLTQQLQGTDQQTESGESAGEATDFELTGEAKALAVLLNHPDWTDTEVAKAVGCSRTSLYRWPRYTAARKAMRGNLPRGSKSKRGDMEAW